MLDRKVNVVSCIESSYCPLKVAQHEISVLFRPVKGSDGVMDEEEEAPTPRGLSAVSMFAQRS